MPTREQFLDQVTAFLQSDKNLAGIGSPSQWQPNRDPSEKCLKLPIEIEGVLRGQELVIVSYPASEKLRFTINIVYDISICRLDFDETGGHTNGFWADLDRLPMIVSGSHFHRWEINKRFIEGNGKLEELKHAELLPTTIRSFDAALRWFCDETKINLPHNHLIELPPRTLI